MAGELYIVLTLSFFSLSFVLTKALDDEYSIIFMNALRSVYALIISLGVVLVFNDFQYLQKITPLLYLALIGSISFTVLIGDTCYFYSQKRIGPAYATSISSITPFITNIISILFLNTAFSFVFLIASFLLVIGVVIINYSPRLQVNLADESLENQEIDTKIIQKNRREKGGGILLSLIAAFSWSVGLILTEYSLTSLNNIIQLGNLTVFISNIIRYVYVSIFLSLMMFGKRKKNFQKTHSTKSKILLHIASITGGGLGSYFYSEAARLAGSNNLSLATTALPLFTLPLSYFILKEKITIRGFFGIFFITGGILIILLV